MHFLSLSLSLSRIHPCSRSFILLASVITISVFLMHFGRTTPVSVSWRAVRVNYHLSPPGCAPASPASLPCLYPHHSYPSLCGNIGTLCPSFAGSRLGCASLHRGCSANSRHLDDVRTPGRSWCTGPRVFLPCWS